MLKLIKYFAQSCFSSLQKPKVERPSLREALEQIYGGETLGQFGAIEDAFLIEQLSISLQCSTEQILSNLATTLSLRAKVHLEVPSMEIIENSPINLPQMQQRHIIPQFHAVGKHGICLVVGDLSALNVDSLKQQGIPVFLGSGAAIRRIWNVYNFQRDDELASRNKELSNQHRRELEHLLSELAEQVASCGGQDIFLGTPSEENYQFVVEEKRYTGKISSDIYNQLLDIFQGRSKKFSISKETANIRDLFISTSYDNTRCVFYLSWKKILKEENRSKVDIEKESSLNSPGENEIKTTQAKSSKITQDFERPNCVLIVDDDTHFQSIIGRIFARKSWEVVGADTPQRALKHLTGGVFRPDLIISDVHMPDMRGDAFLSEIKKLNSYVPVLMLTSDDSALLEANLASLGADAFVNKQDEPEVLIAWAENLALKSRKQQQTAGILNRDG